MGSVRPGGRTPQRRIHPRRQHLTASGHTQTLRDCANVVSYSIEIVRIRDRYDLHTCRLQTRQQPGLTAPVADHDIRLEGDSRLKRRPDPLPSGRRFAQPGVGIISPRRQRQFRIGPQRQHILVGALIQRHDTQRAGLDSTGREHRHSGQHRPQPVHDFSRPANKPSSRVVTSDSRSTQSK